LDDFRVTEHRYWRFAIEAEGDAPDARVPALTEELRSLLDQAVARRLVSDVPLGVFLSGGLDSSTVLALAARHRPADSLDSFTIGFNEASFDESPYAREVAAAIGTRHHERILDFDMARGLAASVLGRLDEPTGDASILPTYLLSSFAREHVTVALSGDGGDELFAGYDPFGGVVRPVGAGAGASDAAPDGGDAAARHDQHEPGLQGPARADGFVVQP
jgi:asparagine synthase (glutamine-hydrolysing)